MALELWALDKANGAEHSPTHAIQQFLMLEHFVFRAFNVAEHAVSSSPQEEAKKAKAGQQIVHHRRDGKRSVRLTAIDANQFQEFSRETISAWNQYQYRKQQRKPNLKSACG